MRATPFFEFLGLLAGSGAEGGAVRLPDAAMQPVAADDVAAELACLATGMPVNGTVELAGPEVLPMTEFVGRILAASGDTRTVVADPRARYLGTTLGNRDVTPGDNPRIGPTRFGDWLDHARGQLAGH